MDYPRMLYKGGDRDAEYVIVNDEAAEAASRKDGYRSLRDRPEADDTKKAAAAEQARLKAEADAKTAAGADSKTDPLASQKVARAAAEKVMAKKVKAK